MSILEADILSFVNGRLNLAETDIGDDIVLVLDDLSDLHLLKAQDTSQSLAATDLTLAYPTDAVDDNQAIISITLTETATNRRLWPLEPLHGDWLEYQRLMESFTTSGRSQPYSYVCQNRYIYPYPPPNKAFTVDIWYYKRHPATPESIAFQDCWRRAIYYGSAFEVACKKKLKDYITIWGQRYEREKDKQRIIHQG